MFQRGETPLHLACQSRRNEVVRQLIEFVKARDGVEVATTYVNSVNEDGASALHYAAEVVNTEASALSANRDVVKLLTENGIDVTLATKAVRNRLINELCT